MTSDLPSRLPIVSPAPGDPPERAFAAFPSVSISPGSSQDAGGSIGLIGAGSVGSTLARSLAERGFQITAVAARHLANAAALAARLPNGMALAVAPEEVVHTSDLVLLAVPDDLIESLSSRLPWRPGQSVVHLSGAKSAAALSAAADMGAEVAALHPLMTFPSVALEPAATLLLERLRGCYWGLEVENDPLAERLRQLVDALGGHTLTVPRESRAPYHIGAVFASNYIVASLGAAAALWETFGVGGEEALRALLPLLRGAVESLAEHGLPQALTGPVARGDAGTVAAHLDWLEHPGERGAVEGAAEMLEATGGAYRALARLALLVAIQKRSITPEQARVLRDLLL